MANLFRYKLSSACKLLLLATGCMVFAASVAFAQAGAPSDANPAPTVSKTYVPTLTFDVASIRQSADADSYTVSGGFAPHSSSFRATNLNFMNLVALAYKVRWDQISGMPDSRAMFNVQAKSDSVADAHLAELSKDQQELEHQHMLQTMLADRFKLKVHWETRVGPAYDLVLSKDGSKMQEAKGEPPSADELKAWGNHPIPPLYQRGNSNVGFDFVAHGASMSDIVGTLAGQFGQPVIDKTGLTGKYDFVLRYHGARLADRKADDLDPVPTLDTAIQDQLGLKLKPTKAPEKILVIDHIENPSEN